jgi:hypothetical protein
LGILTRKIGIAFLDNRLGVFVNLNYQSPDKTFAYDPGRAFGFV